MGEVCPACLLAEALGPIEALDTGLANESLEDPPSLQAGIIPDVLEGATIGHGGRYKILQRIGEGGFGTVYMADQGAPVRRRVAIKILKAGMDTRQVIARFEAERQALAMMDHPNIAKILDGGESEMGRPYFVMELVRGTPITTFCDREKLTTRQRLDLFLRVCRAVQHAHQKGIIHRDLKPANILITVQDGNEPVPKVIDFGVAKAMEANLTDKTLFTRFEQMVGTPAYMSPEQAGSDADAHDIDTRADIYALGVLLYELLTGTTPFEANTLQKAAFYEVRRILRDEEPPRPSVRLNSLEASRRQTLADSRNDASPQSLDKQLRGDLDWIVMKAIEKDRRRRYETANAFALDLGRYLNDDPIEARPPSVGYRLQKFARRHKTAFLTTTTIAAALIAAAIFSTISAFRANDAEKRATNNFNDLQVAYIDLDSARDETELQRNEALWNEYAAKQFPIREAWENQEFGKLERLLDDLVPAPDHPDFRGWEWYFYKNQCERAYMTIDGGRPAFHPIQNALAVVRIKDSLSSTIDLVSASDGSPIRTIATLTTEVAENIESLRWSATGHRLAYHSSPSTAVVLDTSSGETIFKPSWPHPVRPADRIATIDLSHDGITLATGTWWGRVELWNVDSGESIRVLQDPTEGSHLSSLKLNPSGTHLAAALRWGRRTTWEIDSGQAFEYDAQGNKTGEVAWNRSGSAFATTQGDDLVSVFETDQAEPVATFKHRTSNKVAWCKDERLVTCGNDRVLGVWDAHTFEIAHQHLVAEAPPKTIDVDAEGKRLAVEVAGTIKVFTIGDTPDSAIELTPNDTGSGADHPIVWTRNGTQIGSSHQRRFSPNTYVSTLRIWNVAGGTVTHEEKIGIGRSLAWSSDHTALVASGYNGRFFELSQESGKLATRRLFRKGQLGRSSSVSGDGKWLASVVFDSDQRKAQIPIIRCRDLKTDEIISTLEINSTANRWSHDCARVAIGTWSGFSIWNPFSDQQSPEIENGIKVQCVAWAPGDKLVAIGRRDGVIQILDANTVTEVAQLIGHSGEVKDLDWSANGRIASASDDGTVRVWDDATGAELTAFDHPRGDQFLGVRWSPDGLRLAAGDHLGRIFIWGTPDIGHRASSARGLATGIIARHRALR